MKEETSPELTTRASKLKALMALSSIHILFLRGDADGCFCVDRCIDRLLNDIHSPYSEIPDLTLRLAYLLKEKMKIENRDKYLDTYGRLILDDGELNIFISVSRCFNKTEEIGGTLSTEEPREMRMISALSQVGITRVNLAYSGSGNSGQMDTGEFLKQDTVIPLTSIPGGLISDVEDFVYRKATRE